MIISTATTTAYCLGLFAASFLVQEYPVSDPGATAFAAHADPDGTADIFVLQGHILSVYPSMLGGQELRIPLDAEASAVDVIDRNGDGYSEVTVIAGTRVLEYLLSDPDADPTTLFELKTRYSTRSPRPYPSVLSIPYKGEMVLALPRDRFLELRSYEGKLLDSFSLDWRDADATAFDAPLNVRTIDPLQSGAPGGIEFQLSTIFDVIPQLPEELLPSLTPSSRIATPQQTRDASSSEEGAWPWFALETGGDTESRVLYALAQPDYRDTVVRIQRPETHRSPQLTHKLELTAKKKLPGTLIAPREGMPDFNGDGYVDLLLWNAPLPGASVSSLTRAAQSGTWPIRLTVHLYDQKKRMYAGRPAAVLGTRLPILWFLLQDMGSPLRYLALEDFDGDGNTDIAMSVSPRKFSLWLFNENFKKTPDYTAEFSDPITALEPLPGVKGSGKTSALVRTAGALHVLAVP